MADKPLPWSYEVRPKFPLVTCSHCGSQLELKDAPDDSLVDLGPPNPLVFSLRDLWRRWRGR